MAISFDLRLAIASHYSEDAKLLWLQQKRILWEDLAQEAVTNRLAPLLYHSLKKYPRSDVPDLVLERLRAAYYATAARNMRMHIQLKRVTDALDEIGVRYILLKGAALIQDVYGGNMALRPMSDIDILVDSKDYSIACNKIATIAQSRVNLSEDGLISYHQGFDFAENISIEVHSRLLNLAFYAEKPAFNILWKCKGNWRGLSAAYQFVHLCAHATLHHQQAIEYFGADAAFVSQQTDDWSDVLKVAQENDLVQVVQWGLAQIQDDWFIELSTTQRTVLSQLQPGYQERFYTFCATRPVWKKFGTWLAQPRILPKLQYIWAKLFPLRDYLIVYWPVLDMEQPLWRVYVKRLILLPQHIIRSKKQELTAVQLGGSNNVSTQ